MLAYYVGLAWRSLGRRRGLTALMVFTIGFGVAASMTTYAVFRAVSGDPIPWKSARLFVPQIDARAPRPGTAEWAREPTSVLTYTDAMALMAAHRAKHQSAIYQIQPTVVPAEPDRHPLSVRGQAVYGEFFPMLDVPFRYGAGWSADDDARGAAVAVISSDLNDKLFAGADSVGKTLDIDGKDYRIAGVLNDWSPQPRFYNVLNTGGFSRTADDVFVPFMRALAAGIDNAGSVLNCSKPTEQPGFAGLEASDCGWVAFMVELDDPAAVAGYREYLDAYAREQQQIGRFGWPPNNRLRDLRSWLDFMEVTPPDAGISLLVALSLLAVCLVNTVGLLLAKFLRRSGEIGVRRALGARRRAIYAQFLTESGVIGLAGGALGLLLTALGLAGAGTVLSANIAPLVHVDLPLIGLTVVVAVFSALAAGLYPTLRASRVQPALQLKSS